MTSAPEVVDRLIDAVERRDVRGIAECFDLEAQSSQWSVPAIVSGRGDIELMYEQLLRTHPEIAVRIVQRLTVGEVVVDHEEISGYSHLAAGTVVNKVYVYTVRDGRIVTMTGFNAST